MSLNRAYEMLKFLKKKKSSEETLNPPLSLSSTDLTVDVLNYSRPNLTINDPPSVPLRNGHHHRPWLAEISSYDDCSTLGRSHDARSQSAASSRSTDTNTMHPRSMQFCLTLATKSRIMQENVLLKTTIPVGLSSPPLIRRCHQTHSPNADAPPPILLQQMHFDDRVCRLTMNDPKKRSPPLIRRCHQTHSPNADAPPPILLQQMHFDDRVCRLTMNDPKKRSPPLIRRCHQTHSPNADAPPPILLQQMHFDDRVCRLTMNDLKKRSPPLIRHCHQTHSPNADAPPPMLLQQMHFDDCVCRLTVNDPKKWNALSLKLLQALKSALTTCERDNKLRAIILAASPPVFSAGHDLRELTSESGITNHAKIFAECSEVMMLIQNMQLPVIAEVCGIAAAAGCQLAATCDIVIAADNAKFSVPGAKAGIFCSTPGIALARAVPRKVAMDMLLTGDPISAADAVRAGLVSRVVKEADVPREALSVAEKICELSRPVVGLGKTFFYLQVEQDRNTAYRHGERVMVENLRLTDAQEGIKAFTEKRHPHWTHTTNTAH